MTSAPNPRGAARGGPVRRGDRSGRPRTELDQPPVGRRRPARRRAPASSSQRGPRARPGQEAAEQLVDPVERPAAVPIQVSPGSGARPSAADSASTACTVVSWHWRRAQNSRGAGASFRKTSAFASAGARVSVSASSITPSRSHSSGSSFVADPRPRSRPGRCPARRAPAPRPSGAPCPGARTRSRTVHSGQVGTGARRPAQ